MEQPLHDHGQDPVAFGRAFGGDEPVQAQAPDHGEQGVDVAVGEGAFDGEGVFGADEALALEDSAQGIDLLCGPVGEVGQRAFRPPSRQPSRRRTAGRELRLGTISTYMGTTISCIPAHVKLFTFIYMGT